MLAEYARQLRSLSRNAWLYLISNAIQLVSAGALAILYTLYLVAVGYNTAFIGVLADLGVIAAVGAIIPASRLVRRWGWRRTLIWSDMIGAISLGVQLVYPQPAVVIVTTLGVGASVALLFVVNAPLLAAYSTEEERTALFAINNAVALLAGVVGLLLGGVLPEWFLSPGVRDSSLLVAITPWLVHGAHARAYELALLVTGALALPSIIPVLMLREAAPIRDNAADASPGVRLALPTREQLGRWWMLARGTIGRFAFTQALVGFGAGLFGPYVNIYFVDVLKATTTTYSALASALSILTAIGTLAAVPLANHLGKIRTVVLTQVSSLPFLLALGLAPSLLIASIAYLIRGPLMNIANPPMQAYIMEAVPTDQRILASSTYNVVFQVAWAVGSGVGGLLILRAGYPPVFVIAAMLYAMSIALVAFWFGGSGPKSSETAPA
ncbi:MAG TPA: MFS transporter [Ktedonobacterales bacterium]